MAIGCTVKISTDAEFVMNDTCPLANTSREKDCATIGTEFEASCPYKELCGQMLRDSEMSEPLNKDMPL